ncbi:hypothetical protein FACS189476_08260 [Spirochaetia bacterium]|nr:hypothetical protein FACS189476_08260 [Spirochaetia bacterium]
MKKHIFIALFFLAALVLNAQNTADEQRYLDRLITSGDGMYRVGEIENALWYYQYAAFFFPESYRGWLGIMRVYSLDFTDFDFYESEVYMDRVTKTAATAADRAAVQSVSNAFNAQWPRVEAARAVRLAAEAQKRNDNFYNMKFIRKDGVLTSYTGSDEEVLIPEDVTVIGDAAFRQNAHIKRVVIHSRVTAIGNNAFANCALLSDIIIPRSVISIGTGAFQNCAALTRISIPESVKTIPDNAFASCKNLTDVTISNGVTAIGKSFVSCENLANILIPKTINTVADFAFSQCKNLKNVAILNDKVKIGRRAFLACPVSNKDELAQKFGGAIFN